MDSLCNQFQYMMTDDECSTESNCEDQQPQYFGGFYLIWKGTNPIFIDTFIYQDWEANTEYKADGLLWKHHTKDFQQNRFSELNESIGSISDIEIQIIECHLFNEEETYKEIKEILDYEINIYKELYKSEGDNVFKKRKDAYNMKDLLEALEECLLTDELFGDED